MVVLTLLFSVFLITNNTFAGEIKISSDYILIRKAENRYDLHYFYEFPYSDIYFTKQNQGFKNRYQITIQIWNHKELVAGKILEREVFVERYEDTKLQTKSLTDSLQLEFIYPSKNKTQLTLKVKIRDLNSDSYGEDKFDIRLYNLPHRILFYKNNTPNPKRIYSTDIGKEETLGIRLELYSNQAKNCSLLIKRELLPSFPITSDKKKSRLRTEKRVFLVPIVITDTQSAQEKTILSFSSPIRNLVEDGEGKYRITIIVYDDKAKKILTAIDFFEIKNSFFNSTTEYLEMVDRLMYIATETEMRNLKMADVTSRESLWNDFWKKYDPNPITEINEAEEEYFSRIDYCIKKFSGGDRGYKSDRAKIYMKYGEPDYVEYAPFEKHRNAYEIWYYYRLGKQFVFLDQRGFGEFILTEIK
ncbi:MAG: GWxTD domain-containing protein [candidate division WOR-3 bacterium]|nr:GWxTD domain-containing protein [candidate division WOR-3 bacterium]